MFPPVIISTKGGARFDAGQPAAGKAAHILREFAKIFAAGAFAEATATTLEDPPSKVKHGAAEHEGHGDPRAVARQKPADEPAPPLKDGVIYTCPMHPQIRRDRPGHCPICGAAQRPNNLLRRAAILKSSS